EIAGFVDLRVAVCARAPGFVGGAGLSLEHRSAARAPDQAETVALLRCDLFARVEDGVVARAADEGEEGVFARVAHLADETVAREVGKFRDRGVTLLLRGIERRVRAVEEVVGTVGGAAGAEEGGIGEFAPVFREGVALLA